MDYFSYIILLTIKWTIFWFLFTIIWKTVIMRYFKKRNENLSEDKKYTDLEIAELLNNKFNLKEKIIFNSLIIFPISFFFVGFPFLVSFFLKNFQKDYFLNLNMLLFEPTNLIFIIFLVVFIVGIFLFNIFMNIVGYLIPRFNIFVNKNRHQMTNLAEIEDKNKKLQDIKISAKVVLILLIIITPILFLSMNSYQYIDLGGIHVNPFFSLNEIRYDFKDIEKVKARINYYSSDNSFDFSYIINTNDGNSYDFFTNEYSKLNNIDELLKSKNILMDKSNRSKEIVTALNNNFLGNYPKLLLNLTTQ